MINSYLVYTSGGVTQIFMATKFAESLWLKGIIENTNVDLLSIREQMLKQNTPGLGPPDLVLLTKKTDILSTKQKTDKAESLSMTYNYITNK